MVTGVNSFLDEIAGMIAQRRQRMQSLVEDLHSLEGESTALQQAETLYKAEHSITEGVDPAELKGKTQLQALILIARRNGVLNMAEARRTLLLAGLVRNAKNAGSILYTVMARSERFEKVSPGVYKLRGGNANMAVVGNSAHGNPSLPSLVAGE